MSHYVFHPHHEAVIVSSEEYPKYLESGWYDSPLKFPKSPMAGSEAPVGETAIPEKPKKPGRPPKVDSGKALNVANDEPPLDAA